MSMKDRVVAFDLDGTICNEKCWTIEEARAATPNEKMIAKMSEVYQIGFVVVHTARKDELMPITLEWLRRNNVRYHAISNLKMPSDVYIDDLAIHPDNLNYEKESD